MRPRPAAVPFLVAVALALGVPSGCLDTHGNDADAVLHDAAVRAVAAAAGPVEPPPPPRGQRRVLAVVHSHTNRTLQAVSEMVRMLGGQVIVTRDPPTRVYEDPAWSCREVMRSLGRVDLSQVDLVLLGFPVWALGPSPPMHCIGEALDLAGLPVVPVYTYIHEVDEALLERFAATLRERGGKPLPPVPLLIPMEYSEADVQVAAREALMDRPDLWGPGEQDPAPRCVDGPPLHGAPVCHVPEGWVWLGEIPSDLDLTGGAPPRRVRVPAFAIDQREVTVGQYQRCVDAGACRPPPSPDDSGFPPCTILSLPGPQVPMPCAGIMHARDYCAWAGMRLPTTREWVRAARGHDDRAFPWGDHFWEPGEPLRGNFGEKHATGLPEFCVVPDDAQWPADGWAGLAPGCSFPGGRSPFGVCDLAGNLMEWTEDTDLPTNDPVLKGGCWFQGEARSMRIAARTRSCLRPPRPGRDGNPDAMEGAAVLGFYGSGIRCAMDLP